jgi:hypothetical protein
MRGKSVFLLLGLIMLLALAGCTVNQPPSFSYDPGWVVENIDQSYWTSTQPGEIFGDFWVYVTDPDGVADIAYVSVTDPKGTEFVLQDTATGVSHYNSTQDYFGGWVRYYTGGQPNTFQLGSYDVLVRDSAQHEIHQSFVVTAPGSSTSSTGFLYDSYWSFTGTGIAALAKASLTAASNSSGTITVTFNVTDSNVWNGYIWFYDASDNYVAGTDFLRDIAAKINGGIGFYNDGTSNTVTLQASDLADLTQSFADIAGARVVMTDGYQYHPTHDSWYDHRSISANRTF